MEGSLLKKTTGGQWHSRQFKLEGNILTWLKSDGKTLVSVTLSPSTEVKDVKFGTKKFLFDIILAGDTISLGASGEAEKAAWMAALNTAIGKRDEAEGILQRSGARKSVRTKNPPIPTLPTPRTTNDAVKAAPPPAPPPAAPTSTPTSQASTATLLTGGLTTQSANAKLAAKLGGKIGGAGPVLCVVCGTTVYKPEELVVDKAVMHKRCFQCSHCKRQLTMGNFACINSTFYCKVHYFELFAQSGGKYENAFGDAGFKHKALGSYTPGEVLNPGKIASIKLSSPSTPPTAASPTKMVEVMALPATTATVAVSEKIEPATPKKSETRVETKIPVALPKKLDIKPPVSTQKVEKKEIEVLPKKNMDDLRKLIVLPGMQPPKLPTSPKKSEEIVENSSPEGNDSVPTEQQEEKETAPEAPQIRLPPVGINFALEAVKIRQAQLGKSFNPPAEEHPLAQDEGRASVRHSTRLDNSAALSRPKMTGRRAPKVQEVGKLLPKAEIDRMTHDFTFRVEMSKTDTLIVHATSQFERDHWVHTLNANIYMLGLKHELEQAQKRDMMSALQAQLNLENFVAENKVEYSGFLEKVSMKSQRNWKKRWFLLNQKGELMYFENENAKKAKQVLQLTYLTVVKGADGDRLDAPLVINTGAVETTTTETGAALPQNIAIFDNEDVTVDLNVLVPEEYRMAAPEMGSVENTEEVAPKKESLVAEVSPTPSSPKEQNVAEAMSPKEEKKPEVEITETKIEEAMEGTNVEIPVMEETEVLEMDTSKEIGEGNSPKEVSPQMSEGVQQDAKPIVLEENTVLPEQTTTPAKKMPKRNSGSTRRKEKCSVM